MSIGDTNNWAVLEVALKLIKIAMSLRHQHHHTSGGTLPNQKVPAGDPGHVKKDLKHETADIGGFTLMFDDANVELKWNLLHLDRQISITSRYLFWAAVFQGLFFWGDYMEYEAHHLGADTHSVDASPMSSSIVGSRMFHLGLVRLVLGLFPLIGCFLVATGLLIPTQLVVFWMNVCYGIPTLALFYLLRPSPTHWDSLFLVYGLCFFMLPKISPLNFIFGFSGAVVFTGIFIYISAFRLSFQQWVLSNILLSFTSALFCYQSYSSERVSRERWLLRSRLEKEKINLRIVASSIQDDLKRVSSDERPFASFDNIIFNSKGRALRVLASSNVSATTNHTAHDDDEDSMDIDDNLNNFQRGYSVPHKHQQQILLHADTHPHTSAPSTDRQRLTLFFKGLAAWSICYGMGYAFNQVSRPQSNSSDINSSAAFALLMHTMGFSSFLLYVTGQVRWVAVAGLSSFSLLWVFNRTGMENRWVVFSAHSIGYIILAAVLIIMVLVFGGVVLVWSHLIEFLKDVLVRYPHVKDELRENKLLEQVLVQYIANMPQTQKSHLLSSGPSDSSIDSGSNNTGGQSNSRDTKKILQVVKDCGPADEEAYQFSHNGHQPQSTPVAGNTKRNKSVNNQVSNRQQQKTAGGKQSSLVASRTVALSPAVVLPIMHNRSPSTCFFCTRHTAEYLLPACSGWCNPHLTAANRDAVAPSQRPQIAMCTPYTEVVQQRDEAVVREQQLSSENARLVAQHSEDVQMMERWQQRLCDTERLLQATLKESDERLQRERQAKEEAIQKVIKEHNGQLSDLKRLYKNVVTNVKKTGLLADIVGGDINIQSSSVPVQSAQPPLTNVAKGATSYAAKVQQTGSKGQMLGNSVTAVRRDDDRAVSGRTLRFAATGAPVSEDGTHQHTDGPTSVKPLSLPLPTAAMPLTKVAGLLSTTKHPQQQQQQCISENDSDVHALAAAAAFSPPLPLPHADDVRSQMQNMTVGRSDGEFAQTARIVDSMLSDYDEIERLLNNEIFNYTHDDDDNE